MKRLSYSYVKKYINDFGYELISREYKNALIKLSLMCPQGHLFEMRYNDFKTGHRCPECAGLKKLEYSHIKEKIESIDNFNLISKEYKGNKHKLKILCPQGHLFEMRYNDFKTGHRCPECAGLKKLEYSNVKKQIEFVNGYKLKDFYMNCRTKLKILCPKDHEFKMLYHNFLKGQRCPECAKYLTTSRGEKEVLNFVQSIYQGKIIENDRSQIINPITGKFLELDIFLPDLNKAIEYNGIYWHNGDYVKYKDNQKQLQCSEKGIELLIIEDFKYRENKNLILNNISKFLQK